MKINKVPLIDFIGYGLFFMFFGYDFLVLCNSDKSIFVLFTFLLTGIISVIGFIKSPGFISIDSVIYIYLFLFAYYAPIHQYVMNSNIHHYATFKDGEYLFGNIIIHLFSITYFFTKRYLYEKKQKIILKQDKVILTDGSLLILLLGCVISLFFLYFTNGLLKSGSVSNENSDTLFGIIDRIVRFFSVSALLLYISAYKKNLIIASRFINKFSFILIIITFLIVFNPVAGTSNRYILFGSYLIIIACIFEKQYKKTYIILFSFIGFSLIFPAFNFFKYYSVSEISKFQLGGFNVNTNDYDSYQVFLQAIRYEENFGITYGKNILSSIFCFIPRSIWSGKSLPSGQMIAQSFGAEFENISCPIFAEFYIAFGVLGVFVFSILFALIISKLEYGKQKDNILYRGYYFIAIGIMMSYMRGAMLPVSSFWLCWNISFTIAFFICSMTGRKGYEREI